MERLGSPCLKSEQFRTEWKYCINNKKYEIIREKLQAVMEKDGNSSQTGRYSIHSLYFDDYYDTCVKENAAGDGKRFKYRIRYYNDNTDFIRLEKKVKNNSYCLKNSCVLTQKEYDMILCGKTDELLWESKIDLLRRFCVDIMTRGFSPKVIINYEREAFVEGVSNVRVTIDSNITASSECDCFLNGNYHEIPMIGDQDRILEIKYDYILPSYIRNIIECESITQQSFSKYCNGRQAVQTYYRKQKG